MRVISCNVNGIRAAARKGFFEWLKHARADVVCLQETKAQLATLDTDFCPTGYVCYYHDAVKPGYSGVCIYAKRAPDKVVDKLGWQSADTEGRYIQADFGNLSVVSLYLPSGSSKDERQLVKLDFMQHYMKTLQKAVKSKRDYIICGDWNIVHKEIDIKNFKANQKNSGCTPEERAWLDEVFTKVGMVDAFRVLNQKADQYTWWSNRGRAYENNVGWRIDYQVVSSSLKSKVKKVDIYKDKKFSDHAPLIIDYDYNI